MKKIFDVLAWIREVRDRNYLRERKLGPAAKIAQAQKEAQAFLQKAKRAIRKGGRGLPILGVGRVLAAILRERHNERSTKESGVLHSVAEQDRAPVDART